MLAGRIASRNSLCTAYHAMLRLIAAAVTASLSARKDFRRREACEYTPITKSSTALNEDRMALPSSITEAWKGGDESGCDVLERWP